MKKLTLILALSVALLTGTHADVIEVGSVGFTGDFTLNHLYDFNNPDAQPFGWFQLETVSSVTGIFGGHVSGGQLLEGAGALNTESNLPLFSLNGLQFITTNVIISGSDSGRLVEAAMLIVGLEGFTFADWNFVAPPYDIGNFHEDITGPTALQFRAFFDNHHVPESGSTIVLMGLGLIAVFFVQRRFHA